MDFNEYLTQPEIKKEYDIFYSGMKNYFKRICLGKRIDNSVSEKYAIELASVTAEMYYSYIFKEQNKQ